ncbi:MAG: protease [Armatimonadetes bacterium]|nr:protease [Armatimonadota bacterium]
MLELYWICLVIGVLFSLATFIFGQAFDLDGALDIEGADFLNTTTIAAFITAFGGAGVLLATYAPIGAVAGLAAGLCVAFLASTAIQFLYVRPMERAERSVAFSVKELVGHTAHVTIPIPADGYGEVMLNVGGGNVCQIARSGDGNPIATGAQVVVIESASDSVTVIPFQEP